MTLRSDRLPIPDPKVWFPAHLADQMMAGKVVATAYEGEVDRG